MSLWRRVERCLIDNGPLTDAAIQRQALEGWYGPSVKARFVMMTAKPTKKDRKRKLERPDRLTRVLEGLL